MFFSTAATCILIGWYPNLRSSLENHLDPNNSFVNCMRYLSLIGASFNFCCLYKCAMNYSYSSLIRLIIPFGSISFNIFQFCSSKNWDINNRIIDKILVLRLENFVIASNCQKVPVIGKEYSKRIFMRFSEYWQMFHLMSISRLGEMSLRRHRLTPQKRRILGWYGRKKK